MKSVLLLTFVGACAAWATIGDPEAQAILGDTEMPVTGGRPPVPDVTLPTLTREPIQINGVDCECSSSRALPMGKVC